MVPGMSSISSDARAARMLEALLAATDPLGAVAAGGSAAAYRATVDATIVALRCGDDAEAAALAVLLRVAGEHDRANVTEATSRFAAAALDWWRTSDLRGLLFAGPTMVKRSPSHRSLG